MNFAKLDKIVREQEALLRFEHFNSRDAWDLGKLMVEEAIAEQAEMAICIRKLNGYILFQYGSDGTSLNNQAWMQRKFNTVMLNERSSLGMYISSKITGEDVSVHGLDSKSYVFCGGGFPIYVQDVGTVAVVTVSNLPHVEDHRFVTNCLSKYLNKTDVPVIDPGDVD